MSGLFILDENKDAISVEDAREWGNWMRDANRVVARDEFTTEDNTAFIVSTLFLGLNHNYGDMNDEAPILFETMIFGGNPLRDYPERYTYWYEAEAGHQRIVKNIKDGAREMEQL